MALYRAKKSTSDLTFWQVMPKSTPSSWSAGVGIRPISCETRQPVEIDRAVQNGRTKESMNTISPSRTRLLRKLAHIDQEIAASESWLAEHRRDGPGGAMALEVLRDQRESAEQIVILLRATSSD
jgi:hypothetical protein